MPQLERLQQLLAPGNHVADPLKLLAEVLEATIELLSIEENDYSWSSWEGSEAAVDEVTTLLGRVRAGRPDWDAISVLFAPTGPIQEVSLSSGWGEPFVKVAERFDEAFEAWRTR